MVGPSELRATSKSCRATASVSGAEGLRAPPRGAPEPPLRLLRSDIARVALKVPLSVSARL
ncbi:hypothetical protein [Streptomyces sp. ST1020]|uniref:hypothetical protein n=1 Tax=Streptomyces sp. ST1020 TaxID=1848901 RepID=UPI0034C6BAD3